jgi:hypothetical protein
MSRASSHRRNDVTRSPPSPPGNLPPRRNAHRSLMDAYDGVDLQVGEIRAVRTFRIGPGGVLYPLFTDSPWSDGVNTARCKMPGPETVRWQPHATPEPDCTCGFYAYASESAARENPRARHVLAVVSCWGHVIAGTRGIRAEHARIEAIWMSGAVPSDLAAMVATRYPTAAVFADKDTMLAAHPPTALDCYVAEPPRGRRGTRVALRLGVAAALVLGLLPPRWVSGNHDARMVWAAELGFFVIAALILRRRPRTDSVAAGRVLLFSAAALWLVAPYAGVAGTILLRLPMIQIAALTAVQRRLMTQEATRFPATIGPPTR